VPAALGPEQPKIISGLHQKWVAASSPQAKGRVERVHGTHQDRLVKKLRLAAVSNYDDAPKMGIDKVLGSGAVFCRPRVPNWVWASFGIARSASQARGILHEGIACACLG